MIQSVKTCQSWFRTFPHNLFLKQVFLLFFSVLIFSSSLLIAEERIPWEMDETYAGRHPEAFNKLRWEIPNIIRQTAINNSIRLGLPYDEGWRFPLKVGFTDNPAFGSENIFAYVQLFSNNETIRQELNINVNSYVKKDFDHQKVLAHELVHAMMNDAMGTQAMKVLPRWFHEGLAVYGADEGEKLVTSYVQQYYGFADQKIVNGLDGPHGGLDYAEDYLAIKYIVDTHGPNALPLFLREIIKRNGDLPGAYEYTCQESWNDFLTNYREYAIETIRNIKPPRRGKQQRSY